MTTNQEGQHAAIRDNTGTARSLNEDWHALWDAAGIAAGPFNARMLAWINQRLSASYSNISGAMSAYASDAGYDRWNAMGTLVLFEHDSPIVTRGLDDVVDRAANAILTR